MTVHAAFAATAARHPDNAFLCVLAETSRAYAIPAGELTYAAAAARVAQLVAAYGGAGYGFGHRVGLLLENRPDFLLHFLALNALGASIVPINPDLRSSELAYLVGHSEMVLAVCVPARQQDLRAASAWLAVIGPDDAPPAIAPALPHTSDPAQEAALLYTSGTTGLPKGCVVSHTWFLECGNWYLNMGGLIALRHGQERMLTPLPLFHMNALAASTMGMIMSGGCLIALDRFHPRSWWDNVAAARATCIHYLGVMPAILLAGPPTAAERAHQVRFGFGAGIDPRLHETAEARFGFPLIEGWAMTESGCGVAIQANETPRLVGQSCLGKPCPHIELRLVGDDGADVAAGNPGELLIRRAGQHPRHGFFTEYLKDKAATDAAWAGGWFHTGDLVRLDDQGRMYFIDRKKNVIRRSGENIAAVEVESVLLQHPAIRAVAVAAVPDAMRGDEVLACIVLRDPVPDPAAFARDLVGWCKERMAYYKAPGWVALVTELPLTGTNKIQRGVLKDLARTLLDAPGTQDTRSLKRRDP